MVEPTHLGDRHDPPGFWCLDRARDSGVSFPEQR